MAERGSALNQASIVSSNAGYSGTPLWKLKQQGALPKIISKEEQLFDEKKEEEVLLAQHVPLVLVDAVSLGQGDDSRRKPLVRHVLVKDLRKVAARNKVTLPTSGLLENRAPMSLFALFDGQSCAEAPGPLAAEWCASQVLPKLLRNISALPPGYVNDTFVKATLLKTFEDLDKDILQGQPAIHDGCGAAVALTVGDKLFTAVAGKCTAVLVEAGPPGSRGDAAFVAQDMGANQGLKREEDRTWVQENGGSVFEAEGAVCIQAPSGQVAYVSRSLGDRAWKGPQGGIAGSVKLLRFNPDNRVTTLDWADKHVGLLLASAPVAEAVTPREMVKLAGEFRNKPRAVSGEIASKGMEAAKTGVEQCTAVTIYLLPKPDEAKKDGPSAKKQKLDDSLSKVRLRHILVKHKDCGQPFDPVRNRPVMRTRGDAETLLRRALRELTEEARAMKLPADKSKVALQPTTKYLNLCKEMSECTTAQKGGGMCGDLGWLGQDQLRMFGPSFGEIAKALSVGQWSDLASSDHGIHLLQRIA